MCTHRHINIIPGDGDGDDGDDIDDVEVFGRGDGLGAGPEDTDIWSTSPYICLYHYIMLTEVKPVYIHET